MPKHIRLRLVQRVRTTVASVLLLGSACLALAQQGEAACGALQNHFGPFDYRTANSQRLHLVEDIHFTRFIENLTKGGRDNPFGDDIAYTLHVFPNHHRALVTLQKLAEREKTDSPSSAQRSVACYFDRAMRFQPDDLIVRMLFAEYLIKKTRTEEATKQLDYVVGLAGDNPFTHFNVGLLFIDMKNYDRALVQAHRAVAMGFNRTELKERLQAVNKWVEPPARGEAPKP